MIAATSSTDSLAFISLLLVLNICSQWCSVHSTYEKHAIHKKMIDKLPPEIIANVGDFLDTKDSYSCLLASKHFGTIRHNFKRCFLKFGHHNILTEDGCKQIMARQPALEKLSMVCDVEHMSEEDHVTLANALGYMCSIETIDTVKILFSETVDLVRIFENNAHTEKVTVYMYIHQEKIPRFPLRVPLDKTFREVYVTLSDKSYHIVKDILPYCTTVILTKEQTYDIQEYDFRAIDPAKTKMYIHSADMHFIVHGSECVHYIFCSDSYMYGVNQQRIMDHYLAHPMRNLQEFIMSRIEMHLAPRVEDFNLYKLIERFQSQRYVFSSSSFVNIVPMLKHIHDVYNIAYDRLGLICSTVDMCIVGRICQVLLSEDIAIATSNNDLLFTNKMPNMNVVNWTEITLFEPEVEEVRKKKTVTELVRLFTNQLYQFQWMPFDINPQ